MAEVVRHHHRVSRWLWKERQERFLSRIRLGISACGKALPGLLLSFADVIMIPSGMQAAYVMACANRGKPVRYALGGCAFAVILRAIWGLPLRLEMLLCVLVAALLGALLRGRSNIWLMASTAAALVPMVLTALSGAPGYLLLAAAGMVMSALSVPVFFRAMQALEGEGSVEGIEARAAVGYLLMMLLSGCSRMMVFGVNIGMLAAVLALIFVGMYLGMGAGCVAGVAAGTVLALQGLPASLAMVLGMGGFLAGLGQLSGMKRAPAIACGAACVALCGAGGCWGNGVGMACLAAPVLSLLIPFEKQETIRRFLQRFASGGVPAGDGYASAALLAWEKTVSEMAQAVPSPLQEEETRNGLWWQEHLCAQCPEKDACGCMTSDYVVHQVEQVWAARKAPESVWQNGLDGLRSLGCARLYHLRESISALREEAAREERQTLRAMYQREMLTVHLTALSAAARKHALLALGESWWDEGDARRLRKVLSREAFPAQVKYVRRISGHVQAAFTLQTIASDGPQELCRLASHALEVPLSVISHQGDQLVMAQTPLYHLESGVAVRGKGGAGISGDTCWQGQMPGGVHITVVSDGMGHGKQAARESRQTTELIRLCLEAGYTRPQALTAVNGMMLLAGRGERFSTVDLLTVDLWSGYATLDKLGAAASWVWDRSGMSCVSGDTLPLGILETVCARSASIRLYPGSVVLLLSDGVEDAFSSQAELENAIRRALEEETCSQMAQTLLRLAGNGQAREDDQMAVFLRLKKSPAASVQGQQVGV